MPARPTNYWIGSRPSDGKRWAIMTSGTVVDGDQEKEAVYRMYRRYVKQWNDIELNEDRSLAEHTHRICGARVGSGHRSFILTDSQETWLLEVMFGRGFSQFYSDCHALNTFRSVKDIRSIRLHWRNDGREAFARWQAMEQAENQNKGEWEIYR